MKDMLLKPPQGFAEMRLPRHTKGPEQTHPASTKEYTWNKERELGGGGGGGEARAPGIRWLREKAQQDRIRPTDSPDRGTC